MNREEIRDAILRDERRIAQMSTEHDYPIGDYPFHIASQLISVGKLYGRAGLTSLGIECCERAMKLLLHFDPANPAGNAASAYVEMAEILRAAGERVGALNRLEQAMRATQDDAMRKYLSRVLAEFRATNRLPDAPPVRALDRERMLVEPGNPPIPDTVWMTRFRRCYHEPDAVLSGFERFYSADRRFPISIAYPNDLVEFFDYAHERPMSNVRLNLLYAGIEIAIIREDLSELSRRENHNARLVVEGRKSMVWYKQQEMETAKRADDKYFGIHKYSVKHRGDEMAMLGQSRMRAPRIEWKSRKGLASGLVFFWRNFELFTIRYWGWQFDDPKLQVTLSSFRFLEDSFFQGLPT